MAPVELASGGDGEGSDVAPAFLDTSTALDCIRWLLLGGRAASLGSRIFFSIEAAGTANVSKSFSSVAT